MSTHNITFSIFKRKSALIIQLMEFCKGLKDEFETAVVNKPSVFEPLKFYCTLILQVKKFEKCHYKKNAASFALASKGTV